MSKRELPVFEIAVLAGIGLVGYYFYTKIAGIANPVAAAVDTAAGMVGAGYQVATLPGQVGATVGGAIGNAVRATPLGAAVAVGAAKTAIASGLPSLAMPWSIGTGTLANIASGLGLITTKSSAAVAAVNPVLAHKAAVSSGTAVVVKATPLSPYNAPKATPTGFNFLAPPPVKAITPTALQSKLRRLV